MARVLALLLGIVVFPACDAGRSHVVVQDVSQPLRTVDRTPGPAFVFEATGARVYFDTASAFRYAAQQIPDPFEIGGRQQRYRGWPDSARVRFSQGAALVRLHDEYVAAALMEHSRFSLYDQVGRRWADSVVLNRYGTTCGGLCGESWSLFKTPDGRIFLRVLMGVS